MNKTNRGFTMLFAVLISSLLLSIGVAILDLTLKEFTLSSAGKASQFAFYAADDGAECALFWEHHNPNPLSSIGESSFATSTDSQTYLSFSCHGNPVYKNQISETHEAPVTEFSAIEGFEKSVTSFWTSYDGTPYSPCAHVTVTKLTNSDQLTSTVIDSRGYDTCDPDNPYRTERGLQAIF
jgi:hypothetical protein